MTNTALPVSSSERADILDILRGFAILGIFMANSDGFSFYMFTTEEMRHAMPTHRIDTWLEMSMVALVDGKFYSLFSLLFGIGFTIILDRNAAAGRNPMVIFYRRIFILLVIGFLHIRFLWPGDILFLYALIGLVLPLFTKFKDKTLLILSVILILSPVLFDLAKVISNDEWNLATGLFHKAIEIDNTVGITGNNFRTYLVDHDTYRSIYDSCKGGFFWRFDQIVGTNRIPKVLAMFLIGLVAGRRMIFRRPENHIPLLKSIRKWGFIIGIPASLAMVIFKKDDVYLPAAMGLADTISYTLSVIPLSLAYTTSICLLWLEPQWKKRLKIFAPVGRMALTNYIAQTFIGIAIYYGIGLGLGTKVGPAVYLPVAVSVYVVQLIYSNIWFRYFKYGPLEWIWRQLTYGKRISIV